MEKQIQSPVGRNEQTESRRWKMEIEIFLHVEAKGLKDSSSPASIQE